MGAGRGRTGRSSGAVCLVAQSRFLTDLLSLLFALLSVLLSIAAVLMKQPYSPSAELTPDPPAALCVCMLCDCRG